MSARSDRRQVTLAAIPAGQNFAATARRFAAPHEDVQLPRPDDRTEVVAIGTDAAKVMRLLARERAIEMLRRTLTKQQC